MKTKLRVAAAAALMALASAAYAGTQDSLTVTITPTASYGVTVTTTAVNLNFNSAALGSSIQTASPSTVTVTSSYASTGLKLAGQITQASGTPWTFAANTASIGSDQLAAWVVFTDTSVASTAGLGTGNGAYFRGTLANTNNSNVVSTSNNQVGTGAGNTQFIATPGSAGYKTMASLPPSGVDLAASRAHMWMYFTLPQATTDLVTKNVTFTLTAGAPN
jgi:hypothetical protein